MGFANDFKGTAGPWRQGLVLHTKITARWTPAEFAEQEAREHRTVFANFSGLDEGRSRQLVAVCETPEDAQLVATAPAAIAVLMDVLPDALIGESYDPPVKDEEVLREYLFTWGDLRRARAVVAAALGAISSAKSPTFRPLRWRTMSSLRPGVDVLGINAQGDVRRIRRHKPSSRTNEILTSDRKRFAALGWLPLDVLPARPDPTDTSAAEEALYV